MQNGGEREERASSLWGVGSFFFLNFFLNFDNVKFMKNVCKMII